MKAAQPTPQVPAVSMEHAGYAFECLMERQHDVFALLSAIRDRDDGTDTVTTRLIELAWDKLGDLKHCIALGDYFGVDIYADSQGEDEE